MSATATAEMTMAQPEDRAADHEGYRVLSRKMSRMERRLGEIERIARDMLEQIERDDKCFTRMMERTACGTGGGYGAAESYNYANSFRRRLVDAGVELD